MGDMHPSAAGTTHVRSRHLPLPDPCSQGARSPSKETPGQSRIGQDQLWHRDFGPWLKCQSSVEVGEIAQLEKEPEALLALQTFITFRRVLACFGTTNKVHGPCDCLCSASKLCHCTISSADSPPTFCL